jgi:hypothetical protein
LMPPGDDVTVPVPVPAFVTLSGNVVPPVELNVAVTLRACDIVTVHTSAVPVHAPLQPANVEPLATAAVRFTWVAGVALAIFALQAVPQLMPPVFDVTVPVPVPLRVTVSANVVAWLVNVAVTERACVIETVQVDVPVHAPLQPVNAEPLVAAAVSVTDAPLVKFALQVAPQFTPVGFDVTVPVPVPALVTDNEKEPVGPGTNGDRKLPGITACAMPGPCHDTARLSPPVASFWMASM